MDYSTMPNAALFGNTTANSSFAASKAANTPDKNKEKRFYDWHSKQGISAPQDYTNYASQPSPFSTVPQAPNQPSAASPYLHKVAMHQNVNMNGESSDNGFLSADMPEARRKPTLKRSTSQNSPPTPAGTWPKSMFGSRPPSRIRSRMSSTPDPNLDHTSSESNLPPLASIYDELPFDPTPVEPKVAERIMTPTQVRLSNFSEARFPDLIRALRRYYGPILEAYSGLPESESKFPDPEIIPREQLDIRKLQMVQPLSGSDGGPGPWVRITFRDREAAERAMAGSAKGELVIGGRAVQITSWEKDPILTDARLPFENMMDIDDPPMRSPQLRRNSTGGAKKPVFSPPMESASGGGGEQFSSVMPGARVLQPKQVAFEKQDGWLSGWTNALVGGGGGGGRTQAKADEQKGWGQTLVGGYRYVMDEMVGFKYL